MFKVGDRVRLIYDKHTGTIMGPGSDLGMPKVEVWAIKWDAFPWRTFTHRWHSLALLMDPDPNDILKELLK